MKLNLQTQSKEQEIPLAYLEQNASEALAEKINNGIPANKNGTQLIMKKDLAGFMKYATEEARKAAPKGATSACVEDKTVFGWLMHYFEEDSIEGRYFNPDGTPYTPPKKEKKKPAAATAPKVNSKPKQETELTLFDILAAATEQEKAIPESKPEPVVTEPAAVDPDPKHRMDPPSSIPLKNVRICRLWLSAATLTPQRMKFRPLWMNMSKWKRP